MWQDTALALCQAACVPSLLPTLVGPQKPATMTCATSALIVSAAGAVQATLGLWLAVVTSGLLSATWLILTLQGVREQRRRRRELPT